MEPENFSILKIVHCKKINKDADLTIFLQSGNTFPSSKKQPQNSLEQPQNSPKTEFAQQPSLPHIRAASLILIVSKYLNDTYILSLLKNK